MKKITKLTSEQELKIIEYREHFFNLATSTIGDPQKAGRAASKLVEMSGLNKKLDITITSTPVTNCVSIYVPGLLDSFYDEIENCVDECVIDYIFESFHDFLYENLFTNDISFLCLRHSLFGSFFDSFYGSLWLAFYLYCIALMKNQFSEKHKKAINLFKEIAEECSGVWLTNDSIIVCEKPTNVKIEDGKLVDISWG